jgi:uncharacterized protein YkwD
MKKKSKKQKPSILRKIKKIILWCVGSVVGLFILMMILGFLITDDICFSAEDGESVEGEVFFNGKSLGDTGSDGCLMVNKDKYGEGDLRLLTTHNEREVELSFEIKKEDLSEGNLEFTVSEADLRVYRLFFFIEGTNTRLNGDVYLNNKKLGKTTSGTLVTDIEELFPGTITLKWEYKNKPYDTYFKLEKEDFGYSGKSFYITKEGMGYITFDASDLDNKEIEANILKFINTRRKNAGLSELKSSSKVADSARDYAQEIADPNFKPTDKKSAIEKLSGDGVFTFYTDGVVYAEELALSQDEDYVVEQVITTWFNDAWAKEKLLEKYSDMGIGVYLSDKLVVAIGFLSVTEFSVEGELGSRMCSGAIPLYNKNLPFDKDIKVKFELESSNGISVYIVTDEDAQQDCIRRKTIDSIKDYRSVKEIDDEITLPKGAGLLFKTSDYDVDYSYSIKYLSGG